MKRPIRLVFLAAVLALVGCQVATALQAPEIPRTRSEMVSSRLSLNADVVPGAYEIVAIQVDYRMSAFGPGTQYFTSDKKNLLNPVTRFAAYDAAVKKVRYTFTPEEMAGFTNENHTVFYQWAITYKLPQGSDTALAFSGIYMANIKNATDMPASNNVQVIP